METADKVNKIKEHNEAARQVVKGSTTFWREFKDDYLNKRNPITYNVELTQKGKDKAIARLNEEMEVIGMRLIKRLQDAKNKHTKAAKELAQGILMAKLPEVDEKKQHFFNMDVEDLSAKVLYATNTKTAVEALEQIAQLADEPALAASIKDQYRQLTEKALELAAPSERLQLKQSLGRLYDDLRTKAQPEGYAEAKDALGYANHLEESSVVSQLVRDSVFKGISNDLVKYADQPEAYFNDKAEFLRDLKSRTGIKID